jgi:hypothetical protein
MTLVGLLAIFAIYFLPCIVASVRKRRQRQQLAIFILNLLLGWTVLGWIAALVWACTTDVATQPDNDDPELSARVKRWSVGPEPFSPQRDGVPAPAPMNLAPSAPMNNGGATRTLVVAAIVFVGTFALVFATMNQDRAPPHVAPTTARACEPGECIDHRTAMEKEMDAERAANQVPANVIANVPAQPRVQPGSPQGLANCRAAFAPLGYSPEKLEALCRYAASPNSVDDTIRSAQELQAREYLRSRGIDPDR